MALHLVESDQDTPEKDRSHETRSSRGKPTEQQLKYLRRGLDQPGGKLPLFDEYGREFSDSTIRSCVDHGWAEPWFGNPIKPYWLVCKLTNAGRRLLETKQ